MAPNVQKQAEVLRKRLTPAEQILWALLRARKLSGYKFRRQFPVGRTVLDFCVPALRLGIELDGEIHLKQQDYDRIRTEYLNSLGYHILRFSNANIENDIKSVLEQIHSTLTRLEASRLSQQSDIDALKAVQPSNTSPSPNLGEGCPQDGLRASGTNKSTAPFLSERQT